MLEHLAKIKDGSTHICTTISVVHSKLNLLLPMLDSLSNMDICCFLKGQPTVEPAESNRKKPEEDTVCADPETCLSHEGDIEEPVLMKSVAYHAQVLSWSKSGMSSDAKSEL